MGIPYAEQYWIVHLNRQVQYRRLMAMNEVSHAVIVNERCVCCGCAFATLNSQSPVLKCFFIIASWAGCKLLQSSARSEI